MSKTIYLIAVFAAGLSSVIGCAGAAQNGIANFNVAFGVSANGEHIVFSSADGDLYLLNLKTSEVRQLTKTDAIETTPSFSPDGTRVAYAAHEKGAKSNFIFIRSLDGKQIQQLTNTPNVSDSTPSFSADGSQLTFKRAHRYRPYSMGGWTWDDWDVYVMDVDGKQRRRITQQKYYGLRTPRFSRDSKTVIYSADGRCRQCAHDFRGGRERQQPTETAYQGIPER
jgi:TolB protein